jgi:hypothetical protein
MLPKELSDERSYKMKHLDELTDFVNEVFTQTLYPGHTTYHGNRRYTLQSLGGVDGAVSLEIWSEDYDLTDAGEDKRIVYTVDIKSKEVSNV